MLRLTAVALVLGLLISLLAGCQTSEDRYWGSFPVKRIGDIVEGGQS